MKILLITPILLLAIASISFGYSLFWPADNACIKCHTSRATTATKRVALSSSEVAAFKEIADKVAEFDSAIAAEERKLQDLKRYGDSTDQKVVRQWYVHLAILAQLKGGRYEIVRIYDLVVSKVPLDIPAYEELQNHGLPVAFH